EYTFGGRQYLHSIVHDVTERKRAEEALRKAEEKYRSVVENIKEVVFQTDVEGRWTYLNRAWDEITGFAVQDSVGQVFLNYVHPEDRERNLALFEPLIERRKEYCRHEVRYLHRDGGFRWVEVFARLTLDAGGAVLGTSGTLTDITERRAAGEQLRLAASVFRHSHEGIVLADAQNRIVDVNEAFTRITGYAREDVIGANPSVLKSGHQGADFYAAMWDELGREGFWQGEVWNRRKDGGVYPELLTISAVRDTQGQVSHYVGVFADISHIKRHQQELEHIAHYDALTHLPNRILLADRMRLALAQATRSETMVGVCYVDLDGFKGINDAYGHSVGDKLLVEVARRLKDALRLGDTVARLGGDEFVLVLVGLNTVEECEGVLERVVHALAEPFFAGGPPLAVSASIGVALYPESEGDADTLLRHADQAMYEAKQSGKNRYRLFDPEHDRRARSHRARLRELDIAVARNELVLYYQPKVNLRTGEVVGMEALLRWQHPQQGLLLPASFLLKLNNTEMECRLGNWVLESALGQIEAWQGCGLALPVSVNISAPHLEHADFVPGIKALLEAHPLAAGLLELEVLETAALEDVERVAQVIAACRELGVSFALDDFGTGYSSLTYFRRLPADTLKIDKSFVMTMLEDPDDLAIVEGVIGLTRA
ncbi:MAG: EAL domain-containing protein, partial [Zoogloea sp.]|nr:EAL domain-containing protein [Zoogloea sp.]